MGDPVRFREFAKLISERHPDRSARIADVAGGKGKMQCAFRALGYSNVVTFDKRKNLAKPHRQKFYRYQHFSFNRYRKEFDLVVAMHPDAATDHAILYARNNLVPFLVCPCCVIPSASTYWGPKGNFRPWFEHLWGLAAETHDVEVAKLPIIGRNLVLIGRPR